MGSPVSIGDVFALIRLSHHLIEAFRHGPSDLVDAQRRHFALNTALEALKDDFISNAAATVEDLAHQEQMGRIVLDTTQMLSALDKELSKYIEVPTSPNDRGDKKWYSFPRPSKPWKKVKWGLEGNQLVGKMCDELTTHTTLILGVLNKKSSQRILDLLMATLSNSTRPAPPSFQSFRERFEAREAEHSFTSPATGTAAPTPESDRSIGIDTLPALDIIFTLVKLERLYESTSTSNQVLCPCAAVRDIGGVSISRMPSAFAPFICKCPQGLHNAALGLYLVVPDTLFVSSLQDMGTFRAALVQEAVTGRSCSLRLQCKIAREAKLLRDSFMMRLRLKYIATNHGDSLEPISILPKHRWAMFRPHSRGDLHVLSAEEHIQNTSQITFRDDQSAEEYIVDNVDYITIREYQVVRDDTIASGTSLQDGALFEQMGSAVVNFHGRQGGEAVEVTASISGKGTWEEQYDQVSVRLRVFDASVIRHRLPSSFDSGELLFRSHQASVAVDQDALRDAICLLLHFRFWRYKMEVQRWFELDDEEVVFREARLNDIRFVNEENEPWNPMDRPSFFEERFQNGTVFLIKNQFTQKLRLLTRSKDRKSICNQDILSSILAVGTDLKQEKGFSFKAIGPGACVTRTDSAPEVWCVKTKVLYHCCSDGAPHFIRGLEYALETLKFAEIEHRQKLTAEWEKAQADQRKKSGHTYSYSYGKGGTGTAQETFEGFTPGYTGRNRYSAGNASHSHWAPKQSKSPAAGAGCPYPAEDFMPNANHPENGPFKNTPDEASYTTVPPHNACADDPHTGTYAAADAPSTARPPPTHAYQLPQASPAPKAEETPTEPPQTHAYPLPPPPEKPKLPPGKLFKVLYNYNAMRAFEMSLKVNELILVENPSNEIWWFGKKVSNNELTGAGGLVHNGYVKEVKD